MANPKPLRVSITLTLEVENPADWSLAFGIEGRRNIAADVREYVLDGVQQYGVFGNGEVDAKIVKRN
jgi:hypothetical protein